MSSTRPNNCSIRSRPGVVLLVTLVLLVVISTLGYMLSSRIAIQRHRDRYIVDYQAARYACDSAVKFALATLQDMNTPQFVIRSNEPDFSDLFHLSEVEYQQYLAQWVAKWAEENPPDERESSYDVKRIDHDVNDLNDFNDFSDIGPVTDSNDPNSLTVRGPYSPVWPLITEPVEFEIGSAEVKIEIEDENAKYPICWAILNDRAIWREIDAGLETFCEWMEVNEVDIDLLKEELKEISKIKPFQLDLKPIVTTERVTTAVQTQTKSVRGRRTRLPRTQIVKKTVPATVHTADFARVFHSSLIDTEVLARPTIVSETRKESALKYMGLWGSKKVNVNSAPRQVLEAAFCFGGDADRIAEEIIQRRQQKPFENIEELKRAVYRYSDSIGKCEKYITTVSRVFTIRVTAVSGAAKASAIIGITKDGKKVERIAVISG